MGEYTDIIRGLSKPDEASDTSDNGYRGFIRLIDQEKQARTRGALIAAQAANPDQAAKAVDLAGKVGLPPDVVQADLATHQRQVELDDAARTLQSSPLLRSWLADTVNASVARDDLANLSWWERLGHTVREIGSRTSAAYHEGERDVEEANLGYAAIFDQLNADQTKRLDELGTRNGGPTKWWTEEAAKLAAQYMPSMLAGGTRGLQTGMAFGAGAALLGQAGPQVALPEELITVPAATLTGFGVGARAGFFQQAFRQEAGSAYSEFRQIKDQDGTPLDPGAAKMAALAAGLINGGLELVGGEAVLSKIPGLDTLLGRDAVKAALQRPTVRAAFTDLAKRYASGVTVETATEVAQEAVTILAGEFAKMASDGNHQPITGEEAADRLVDTGAAVAKAMALLGAPGPAMHMGRDVYRARKAETNQQVFQAIADNAQGSKLRERLPAKFREFVDAATQDGPVENVFVPAERFVEYFQGQQVDPYQLVEHIPGMSAETLREALATGGDVVIPTADYATHLAPNHHEGLRADLRLAPDEMTAREAEVFKANFPELFAQAGEAAGQEQGGRQAARASDAQVFEAVRGQLLQAGTAPDVADKQAALWQSFFRVMGDRTGQDPAALYDRMRLRVEGSAPEALPERQAPARGQATEQSTAAPEAWQMTPEAFIAYANQREVEGATAGIPGLQAQIAALETGIDGEIERLRQLHGDDHANTVAAQWLADRQAQFARLQAIADGSLVVHQPDVAGPIHGFHVDTALRQGKPVPAEVLRAYPELAAQHGRTLEQGQPGAPVVSLRGDELAPPDADLKTLRTAAKVYYRDVLKALPANSPVLGLVEFTGKGEDKAFSTSADPRKLRMIWALRDIIERGEYMGRTEIAKERRDDVIAFHWVQADVELGGETLRVGVSVYEDRHGRKFYNLNPDLGEHVEKQKARRGSRSSKSGGREPSSEDGSSFNQDIASPADGINLTILQGRKDTPRGAITFPAGGLGQGDTVIKLFRQHDLSTFLHESGHFFLEAFRTLATDAAAPEELKGDWATLRAWLGAKEGEALTRDQHEKFARGFEAYLFEGRAPSVDLQSPFARFRAWLVHVYKQVRSLNVEISNEVRGVLDRMLASEEEISAVERQQQMRPLFDSADRVGMSEADWQAYQRLAAQARKDAEDDLMRRAMAEVAREQTQWWKDERAKVKADIEAEVNARPVYQALHFLRTGEWLDGEAPEGVKPMKLARDVLAREWGDEVVKRLSFLTAKEGGVHPDAIADLFGFSSGDEFIQAALRAPARTAVIENETDLRMHRLHGDMLRDGRIAEEALAAVHNDARGHFLAAELRALSIKVGQPQGLTTASMAREIARRTLAGKTVREAIRTGLYSAAEMRAAKAAERALAAGDLAEAARQKHRQLLSHYLFMEARRAADEVDAMLRYVAKFTREGTRKALAGDYIEQIDDLLARFDFRRATAKEVAKRLSLADWVRQMEADGRGHLVAVDEKLLAESRRQHYTTLPMEELRGLRDTLKNIEHLGRLKEKLLAAQADRQYAEVVQEITDTIYEHGRAREEGKSYSPTTAGLLKKGLDKLHAEHTKLEFLFRRLDGMADLGPVWRHLFKPLADAEAAERKLMREMVEGLKEAFDGYGRLERARWYSKRTFFPEVGKSFTKAELLAMALNWGNEGNRMALVKGLRWTQDEAEAVLGKALDKRDWDTVQKVWDLIERLWPRIADLQKELTGVAPEKIEPAAIVTPWGTYRGGYYPLKYDPEYSHLAFQREEKQATQEMFGSNWLRPATRQGHTKERVGSLGQRVKLDLSVLSEHVANVVHDLTHRKAIIDVDRLTQDDRVRTAIEEVAGKEMYRIIRPWLQNIAADKREPATTWERIIGRARLGATVVNMGWKITTALAQPLGYLQSIDRLGERWGMIGLAKFYGKPWEMGDKVRFVLERSEQMRERMQTFDRDVNDQLQKMTIRGPAYEVEKSFFALTGLMDMGVAVPTWLGAYEKGMHEFGGDEAKAVDYADSIVRMTQSAGGAKDLALVQQGGPVKRMFTMFYSYFSVLYNMAADRITGFEPTRAADYPRLVASAFYLWFAPAVLGELIVGRGPDPEDDDDKWLTWALKKVAAYPFQAIVGVRDIAQALFDDQGGYEMTPVADAFKTTVKVTRGVVEGDATRPTAKAAALAAGYWGALPTRQLWITGEHVYDYATDNVDEFSIRDALLGKKRKP